VQLAGRGRSCIGAWAGGGLSPRVKPRRNPSTAFLTDLAVPPDGLLFAFSDFLEHEVEICAWQP
jgi:hypothetical protein